MFIIDIYFEIHQVEIKTNKVVKIPINNIK